MAYHRSRFFPLHFDTVEPNPLDTIPMVTNPESLVPDGPGKWKETIHTIKDNVPIKPVTPVKEQEPEPEPEEHKEPPKCLICHPDADYNFNSEGKFLKGEFYIHPKCMMSMINGRVVPQSNIQETKATSDTKPIDSPKEIAKPLAEPKKTADVDKLIDELIKGGPNENKSVLRNLTPLMNLNVPLSQYNNIKDMDKSFDDLINTRKSIGTLQYQFIPSNKNMWEKKGPIEQDNKRFFEIGHCESIIPPLPDNSFSDKPIFEVGFLEPEEDFFPTLPPISNRPDLYNTVLPNFPRSEGLYKAPSQIAIDVPPETLIEPTSTSFDEMEKMLDEIQSHENNDYEVTKKNTELDERIIQSEPLELNLPNDYDTSDRSIQNDSDTSDRSIQNDSDTSSLSSWDHIDENKKYL